MDRKQFLAIVKKHFLKYGLSEKTLGEITTLVQNSFGEDEATEETVLEQLKAYEPMAKAFQSEIDSRVANASKSKDRTTAETTADDEEEDIDTGSASGKKPKDTTKSLLEKLITKIDNLERGQSVKSNNETAVAKLKELKMSDREIEAAMFGRNFETAEAVEDFVNKQSELYEEILKDRVKEQAGEGFSPMSNGGNYSKASVKNDIEEFNKQH